MKKKEEEYKELFLGEAQESHEEINRLLTVLEKNPEDTESINAIFRIIHTLKGNAAAMGFADISELSHAIEDLFGVLREKQKRFDANTFESIFKGIDVLGNLIEAISSNKKIAFKGIKTKIEVLTRKLSDSETADKQESQDVLDTLNETIKNREKSDDSNNQIERNEWEEIELEKEEDKDDPDKTSSKVAFSDMVQIPVRKLDNLLDLIGELIIERDRIITTNNDHTRASEYSRLTRITSDLQYSVMDARLIQVGFLFNKLHRVVRDVAAAEGKKVNLKIEGSSTEIDRNILQIISDSLVHLIRNAIGHGIEQPEERKKAGKSEEGELILIAQNDKDSVIIDIVDDGKGFNYAAIRERAIEKGLLDPKSAKALSNEDLILFIFEPGFSTSKEVSLISGRGVGMDVVKSALDKVGGNVKAQSEAGAGSKISLRLPSSMAVKATLLFELSNDQFAIPLAYTESVVSIYKSDIHKFGKDLVIDHLGRTINVVFLNDLFGLHQDSDHDDLYSHKTFKKLHAETKMDIIVVSYNNRTLGLVVDRLLQRKEIVEKPLRKPMEKIGFVSGVTILGNGSVCPVINIPFISTFLFSTKIRSAKTMFS